MAQTVGILIRLEIHESDLGWGGAIPGVYVPIRQLQ